MGFMKSLFPYFSCVVAFDSGDSLPLMAKYGTAAKSSASWCPEISPQSDYLDCFETEWHLKPLLWYLLSGCVQKSPVMFVATRKNHQWTQSVFVKTLAMQRSEGFCGRVCTLGCVSDSRRPQTGTFCSLWQRFCQTVIGPWKVKKSLTQAVFSMRLWLLTWTNNSAGQSDIFHRQEAGLAHGGFVHSLLYAALQSTPAEAGWDPTHFTGWSRPWNSLKIKNSKWIHKLPEWPEILPKTFWTEVSMLSWGGSYNWPGCLLDATLRRYSKHLIWPSSWSFMRWWRTWQKGHRTDLAQLAAWLRSESVLMDGSAHQTFIFGASRTGGRGLTCPCYRPQTSL